MKKILLLTPLFAMMLGFSAPPQDLIPRIIESLKSFLRDHPQEKVYLHTDRDHYHPSQTIWMKFYQLHAHYDIPLSLSGVIHVDLIDDRDSVLHTLKFPAQDGRAQGAFTLPADIPVGHYRLRPYTRLMLNFNHQLIHDRHIFIGTVHKPVKDENSVIDKLEFYPESGHLINNILTRIVVKAQDQKGGPVTVDALLLNARSDTLQEFSTASLGLGSFTLRPQENDQYRVRIPLTDSTFRDFPINQVVAHGISLNVTTAGANFIRAMVQASPKYQGDSLVITVVSKGQIYFAARGLAGDQPLLINFPRKELPTGISTVTVFDEDGLAQAQRSLFMAQALPYRVTVRKPESPIKTRQQVKFEIEITDSLGQALKGDFSVNVVDKNIPRYRRSTIRDFVHLNSELTDPMIGQELHLENLSDKQLDLILNAQTPHRFTWEQVLKGQMPPAPVPIERSGFNVSGNIQTAQGNPLSQSTVMLSSKELPELFRWGVTNDQGDFVIQRLNVTGTFPAVLKLNDTLVNHESVVIALGPGPAVKKSSPGTVFQQVTSQHPYLSEYEIKQQINEAFKLPSTRAISPATAENAPKFYGEVDKTVDLDEYIELPSMEEVFRELLPGVRLRDRDGYPEIRVVEIEEDFITGERLSRYQDEGPLLLVNNIPVFDPNLVVNLDPSKVSKIDIVYGKRSIFGENILQELPFKGILSFTTKEPVDHELELKAVQRFQLRGFEPKAEFPPQPADLPFNVPDLRDLLLWKPYLQPDENGQITLEFITSDLDSDFEIAIQGLTDQGIPVHHLETFSVDFISQ